MLQNDGVIHLLFWLILPSFAADKPLSSPSQPALGKAIPLFIVQRSTNANELVYEATLTDSGFPKQDPIQVHWVMKAKEGGSEALTAFEKKSVFGAQIQKVSDDEVSFSLKALKNRSIVVKRSKTPEGGWIARAFLKVKSGEHILDRLFIQMRKGGIVPKVAKISLFLHSVEDSKEITDEFIP